MYRAVLAVVLATALVGATLPALGDARRDHTAATVESELAPLERDASRLLATDDAVPGDGARRVVRIDLPAESWADAGVTSVALAAADNGSGAVFAWQVAGGRRHERRHPSIPLATPDGGPVRFRSPGSHRLVLELDGRPGDPRVVARRFTRADGARTPHATPVTEP